MKRALVLGGGGGVGIAWETAMLAGLLDGGLDARAADLIIGTSAGSVVGASIAHGRDPRELMRDLASSGSGGGNNVPPDPTDVAAVFRLWGSFDEMTEENRAAVGKLAMAANTVPQDQWLEGFAQYGWPAWPETPLLIAAVDCESGALRAFSRDDGVPIERAVAASCAVPGLFPAVTIDGRHYTDGGVRSWTSADLALRVAPDNVLIVAPAGDEGPGVRGLAARQVAAEVAMLESAGVSVRLITFDEAAREAGQNLMDRAAMPAAAAAGASHARQIAAELSEWWRG